MVFHDKSSLGRFFELALRAGGMDRATAQVVFDMLWFVVNNAVEEGKTLQSMVEDLRIALNKRHEQGNPFPSSSYDVINDRIIAIIGREHEALWEQAKKPESIAELARRKAAT